MRKVSHKSPLMILYLACFACAAYSAPNVILISADTLRADALGFYGNALDTSPNIDGYTKDT